MRKVLCVNSVKIIGMLSTGWVTLLGSKSCRTQTLHNLLMGGGGLDPASQSSAPRLEELSEYLPVLVADNAQFVRDAQNINTRAAL